MSSPILLGCDEIIDRWLGLDETWAGRPPRYGHKSTLLKLQEHPPNGLDGLVLINELLEQITTNCKNSTRTVLPSKQNWRFSKQTMIAAGNPSPEKGIEKSIVKIAGDDWGNQMPTCSGLVDDGGRHCNVDLVWRTGSHFTFIELKVETNSPLYAAMELLQYGLVYAFSRQFADRLGYSKGNQPVLGAEQVHLSILAPAAYYARYHLCWLEETLCDGLSRFSREHEYGMDFQFEQFPDWFQPPWPEADLAKALTERQRVIRPKAE